MEAQTSSRLSWKSGQCGDPAGTALGGGVSKQETEDQGHWTTDPLGQGGRTGRRQMRAKGVGQTGGEVVTYAVCADKATHPRAFRSILVMHWEETKD